MTYTLQEGVVLAEVCEEFFLVASGPARGKVPPVEGVTRPGAYFWRLLEQKLAPEEIIRRAAADYRVPEETALAALRQFADALKKKGYLTVNEDAHGE